MSLTPRDHAKINDSLNVIYDKTRTGNFFDPNTDAFLAYCEDESDSNAGSKYFSVQVVGKGDVGSSGDYLSAGGTAVNNEFLIRSAMEHWKTSWTLEAMEEADTKGATGAYDLAKESIDIARDDAKARFGINLGGKGWGSKAGIQAVTTGASGTITLGMPDGTSATAVPELARRFQPGDKLYSADAEDSGNMRGTKVTKSTSDAVATIVSINGQTGVLTCDTVPASFAVGDYIGRQGDRNYSASDGTRLVIGMEAWLSPEVSTGTLGGVSLNGRPDLQPIRFDANGKSIKDGLIEADKFYSKGQEKLKVVQVTRPEKGDVGKTVSIGTNVYELNGMGGTPVPLMPSNFIRPNTCFYGPFMSKRYGFKLRHTGPAIVNTTSADGQVYRLRPDGVTDSTGDVVPGFQAEGTPRAALLCRHPNNYMVITNLSE